MGDSPVPIVERINREDALSAMVRVPLPSIRGKLNPGIEGFPLMMITSLPVS